MGKEEEKEAVQRRKEEEKKQLTWREGGSFQCPSDGILPSPREWRGEIGRKRRGERERERRAKRRM